MHTCASTTALQSCLQQKKAHKGEGDAHTTKQSCLQQKKAHKGEGDAAQKREAAELELLLMDDEKLRCVCVCGLVCVCWYLEY